MKPRIVILSAFLSPLRSGAEACAEEVSLELCDRFDITIVTARMRGDLPKKDMLQGKVPVVRVGFGCTFDKWLYPFLAPFAARRLQPQVIHAVLESFAGLALVICRFVTTAKRILTMQTTNTSLLKGLIVRSPDRVTAISKALIEIGGTLGRTDIVHIPNGLHLEHIPSDVEKIPGRIVFVGRLEPMKGIDTLLQAFAKIAQEDSRATLHIVGEGSERTRLGQIASELGLVDRVSFQGFVPVPDVYTEFAEAEIFCGLSRSEAFGNVFVEAQAAGCAVVGTRVGGIPDTVEDGVTGLLVPVDDKEAATDALQTILRDADLRKRLSVAGQENAQQYIWKEIAGRYAQVY